MLRTNITLENMAKMPIMVKTIKETKMKKMNDYKF